MRLKIEFEIDVDENMWCSHNDNEEMEWFISLLNDGSTTVILHSNEVGDEIGSASNFKYKIINTN